MMKKGWYGLIPIFVDTELDVEGFRRIKCVGRGKISIMLYNLVITIWGFDRKYLGINN